MALGVPDFWFNRDDGKKVAKSHRGLPVPGHLRVPAEGDRREHPQADGRQFLTVTEEMEFVDTVQNERGSISPYEALIVASIAQAEAGNKDDLARSPGWPTTGSTAASSPATAWRSTSRSTTACELDRQADQVVQADDGGRAGRPEEPVQPQAAGPDRRPRSATRASRRWRGRWTRRPGNWLYFVAIDKEGHSAFAETYRAAPAQRGQGPGGRHHLTGRSRPVKAPFPTATAITVAVAKGPFPFSIRASVPVMLSPTSMGQAMTRSPRLSASPFSGARACVLGRSIPTCAGERGRDVDSVGPPAATGGDRVDP